MKLLPSFLALIFMATVLLYSCKKEPAPAQTQTPTNCNGNPIQFNNLQVGQTSCYLGLTGTDYNSNSNTNFDYSDDTLQIAIISQDTQGYLVAESFHYKGDVASWFNPDKDSIYQYYLKVLDDTLRLTPLNGNYVFSRIFAYQVAMRGLPLTDFNNQQLNIQGWKTNLPYCECRRTGFVLDYNLFGNSYPHLNVLIENSAMSLDGNGETYVFSAAAGLVRHSTYSWWDQTGIGWDLLP